MEISTVKGAPYVVTNTTGAEIEVQSAGGAVLCKVPATSQAAVYAVDEALVVPDGVVVTACRFNGAPVAVSGGGGVSVTVDQAFSATSENAQSGKAVAGAFSTYNVKNQGSAVCLGQNSSVAGPGRYAIVVGSYTSTGNYSSPLAIGAIASCNGDGGISIGSGTQSSGSFATAIGSQTKNKDKFTAVIGALNSDNNTMTQLYLIAAGSPLATKYESGSACLGYVVKDTSGNIIECGTRKLSELLTSNTAFAPAAFGLDDEPTPGPFLPTGIMEPMEIEDLTESEQ